MAHGICPWWLGYGLLNPLRRLVEDPARLLGGLIREGMLVLEPGCGMGYFTLPLARMVGPGGRVIAVDVQPRMLSALRRRAARAGLSDRIETVLARSASLGVGGHAGKVDLALAIHVVHELPDPKAFFAEVFAALKPGARLLIAEPRGHVSEDGFAATLAAAVEEGFRAEAGPGFASARTALLARVAASAP